MLPETQTLYSGLRRFVRRGCTVRGTTPNLWTTWRQHFAPGRSTKLARTLREFSYIFYYKITLNAFHLQLHMLQMVRSVSERCNGQQERDCGDLRLPWRKVVLGLFGYYKPELQLSKYVCTYIETVLLTGHRKDIYKTP